MVKPALSHSGCTRPVYRSSHEMKSETSISIYYILLWYLKYPHSMLTNRCDIPLLCGETSRNWQILGLGKHTRNHCMGCDTAWRSIGGGRPSVIVMAHLGHRPSRWGQGQEVGRALRTARGGDGVRGAGACNIKCLGTSWKIVLN